MLVSMSWSSCSSLWSSCSSLWLCITSVVAGEKVVTVSTDNSSGTFVASVSTDEHEIRKTKINRAFFI